MRGTIQSISNTSGGFDEFGIPIGSEKIYGREYECVYSPNFSNNKGVIEGATFTQSAFTIYVYDMGFQAETILLKDKNGKKVCEKKVQSLDELESVQRIRVIV